MSEEIITAIVTSVVAIIGAFGSMIVSYLESKARKKDIEELKKSLKSATNLYVICPECSTKIYLSKIDIQEE